MRLFTRLTLAVVAAGMVLSGCAQAGGDTTGFTVTRPDPQSLIAYREQQLVDYVFSDERRDTLDQVYKSVIWKPIDLMLDGKIPYELEGAIGTEPETGHIAYDPDTFEVVRLPITPDSWVVISSTLPSGESWNGIRRIHANVKLHNGEIDRSVTPDQIDVAFDDNTGLWMNARVKYFWDSQTRVDDSWVSLWYSSSFIEGTDVNIRQKCSSEKGCSPSSSPFKGHETEFRIEVNGDFSASVKDAQEADARFIEVVSRWNSDGSNWHE